MTALRLCAACKRHVRVADERCPFCAAPVTSRPQYVRPARIARAAIFSAALVACSEHHAAPAAGSAHAGSDDLEQLLDEQPRVAEHPEAPADAAVDAAQAVAAENDASVDAGVDEQAIAAKKKHELDLQRQRERRLEQLRVQKQLEWRRQNIPKPYGAPPARRRVV